MFEILPIDANFADLSTILSLSEIDYRFIVKYNGRGQFWSVSIYTLDDVLIVGGVRIVTNYSLFSKFTTNQLFPGRVITIDTSDANVEPTRDSLGNTIFLVYDTSLL